MSVSSMKDLLKHELGDLLYAEQLILKMLGTLTREVKNPEMLARVQEHIGETEEQIQRLRRAFEAIGEKAKAETCEAAVGLKAEHDGFKKDENPSRQLLEAFDLGSSLRVEHYEIAGYRSAIAVATAMGEREVAALLGESLREEEAMASFIERNSVRALKALGAGIGLATGAAEVQLTASAGGSSRGRGGASKSSGGGSKSSSASRSGSKSSGSTSTASKSSGGSKSSGSKSSGGGSKPAGSKPAGSKASGGSKSASRASSAGRTTAERASGSKSGGSSSKSGGSSSKPSSGGKSSASKSSGGGKPSGGKSASKSRGSR
jgi:ferritin-like metal-binding protein YciE